MSRKIMCSACGRIHEAGKCPRPRPKRNPTEQTAFRSSYKWSRLSKWIRERDSFLCQACRYNLDGEGVRYTGEGLEVHHIESLEENYDLRSDEYNLITLCRYHHEKAESGGIKADQLKEIAIQNTDGFA